MRQFNGDAPPWSLDKDGDRRISRAEFLGMNGLMDSFDKNHDCYIDEIEREAKEERANRG